MKLTTAFVALIASLTLNSQLSASVHTDREGNTIIEGIDDHGHYHTKVILCQGCGGTQQEITSRDGVAGGGVWYAGHERCDLLRRFDGTNKILSRCQLNDTARWVADFARSEQDSFARSLRFLNDSISRESTNSSPINSLVSFATIDGTDVSNFQKKIFTHEILTLKTPRSFSPLMAELCRGVVEIKDVTFDPAIFYIPSSEDTASATASEDTASEDQAASTEK